MDKLNRNINSELDRLTGEKLRVEAILAASPQGRLQYSVVDFKRYYRRMYYEPTADGRKKTIESLGKTSAIIDKLAEKKFYEGYLARINESISVIGELQTCAKRYNAFPDDTAWDELPKWITEILDGAALTLRQKQSEWRTAAYDRNMSYPENLKFTTAGNETVRSKSEREIANCLFEAGLAYHPDALVPGSDDPLYADFIIKHPRTDEFYYWEHEGMLDSGKYVGRNMDRIARYAQLGIFPGENLIITAETAAHPLETRVIKKIIDDWF